MLAGSLGQPFQVGHAQVGIGGRLDEERAGVGANRVGDSILIVHRDERGSDAPPLQELLSELARAAVRLAEENDVVAGREQRQQRAGDGVHPRSEEHRAVAPLERRQLALDGGQRGITVSPVFVAQRQVAAIRAGRCALRFALHKGQHVRRIRKRIRRGLIDGSRQRAKWLALRLPGVNGLGGWIL